MKVCRSGGGHASAVWACESYSELELELEMELELELNCPELPLCCARRDCLSCCSVCSTLSPRSFWMASEEVRLFSTMCSCTCSEVSCTRGNSKISIAPSAPAAISSSRSRRARLRLPRARRWGAERWFPAGMAAMPAKQLVTRRDRNTNDPDRLMIALF